MELVKIQQVAPHLLKSYGFMFGGHLSKLFFGRMGLHSSFSRSFKTVHPFIFRVRIEEKYLSDKHFSFIAELNKFNASTIKSLKRVKGDNSDFTKRDYTDLCLDSFNIDNDDEDFIKDLKEYMFSLPEFYGDRVGTLSRMQLNINKFNEKTKYKIIKNGYHGYR